MSKLKRTDTRVRVDLGQNYPKVAALVEDKNKLMGAQVWTVPTAAAHLIDQALKKERTK